MARGLLKLCRCTLLACTGKVGTWQDRWTPGRKAGHQTGQLGPRQAAIGSESCTHAHPAALKLTSGKRGLPRLCRREGLPLLYAAVALARDSPLQADHLSHQA